MKEFILAELLGANNLKSYAIIAGSESDYNKVRKILDDKGYNDYKLLGVTIYKSYVGINVIQ